MSKIPQVDKAKIMLENKLFVKLSSCYYNSNPELLKKAVIKKKIIQKFMHDMNQEAEVPYTPSSNVRHQQFETVTNGQKDDHPIAQGNIMRMVRLSSMFDIIKKEGLEEPVPKAAQERQIRSKLFPSHRETVSKLATPSSRRNSLTYSKLKPTAPIIASYSEVGYQQMANNTRDLGIKENTTYFSNFIEKRKRFISEAEERLVDMITIKLAECSICRVEVANAMYSPCFHGGVCVACANQCYLQDVRQCPICRQVLSFNVDHREGIKN